MEMSYTVRRIMAAQIRKIRPKTHLQINDRDAGGAGGSQNGCNRANGLPDRCNIEPQTVDKATLCGKIILHVDYNKRSLGNIDLNLFRFCVKFDDAALEASGGSRLFGWRRSLSGFTGRGRYTTYRGCRDAGSHKSTAGHARHRILHVADRIILPARHNEPRYLMQL